MAFEKQEIGDAVSYCGDALEVLEQLAAGAIDALIVDPPYSSGGMYRGDRMQSTGAKYVQTGTQVVRPDFAGDNRDQRAYGYWCALWLSAALKKARPGAPLCMFTDWRQLPVTTDILQAGGWMWRGVVPWDKTGAVRPALGRFASQCEYVVWGSAGPMSQDRAVGCLPGFYTYRVETKKEHITQKPVNLLLDLVKICPPGGVVADVFMGAGTTGVAAIKSGRKFIGVEIEPRYFDIACRRIENTVRQPDMLPPCEGEQATVLEAAANG